MKGRRKQERKEAGKEGSSSRVMRMGQRDTHLVDLAGREDGDGEGVEQSKCRSSCLLTVCVHDHACSCPQCVFVGESQERTSRSSGSSPFTSHVVVRAVVIDVVVV